LGPVLAQDRHRRQNFKSQFTSIRYSERLAEIGAVPSIGTVGDSFDNALAETVNDYYKSEPSTGLPRAAGVTIVLATMS